MLVDIEPQADSVTARKDGRQSGKRRRQWPIRIPQLEDRPARRD
jgi:hypothetical protein